jgi:hypothetical protein
MFELLCSTRLTALKHKRPICPEAHNRLGHNTVHNSSMPVQGHYDRFLYGKGSIALNQFQQGQQDENMREINGDLDVHTQLALAIDNCYLVCRNGIEPSLRKYLLCIN